MEIKNKNIIKANMYYLKYLKVKNKNQKNKIREMVLKITRKVAYSGDPIGQYELGILYNNTTIVKCNYKKAFYWFMKAAKQGHEKASNTIGFYYDHGIYVDKNEKKAIYWYKKAADAGDSCGIHNLRLSLKAMEKKKSKKVK